MINVFKSSAVTGHLVNRAVILQNATHPSSLIYRTGATHTIPHQKRGRRSNRHRQEFKNKLGYLPRCPTQHPPPIYLIDVNRHKCDYNLSY